MVCTCARNSAAGAAVIAEAAIITATSRPEARSSRSRPSAVAGEGFAEDQVIVTVPASQHGIDCPEAARILVDHHQHRSCHGLAPVGVTSAGRFADAELLKSRVMAFLPAVRSRA